jgi:hypothetical protein
LHCPDVQFRSESAGLAHPTASLTMHGSAPQSVFS